MLETVGYEMNGMNGDYLRNISTESLVLEYRKTGNPELSEIIYERVRYMIYEIANSEFLSKISRGLPTLETDDLAQEGYFGLWRAIKNFDPRKRVKFTTYAFSIIKQQLKRANKKMIHMNPDNKLIILKSLDESYNGGKRTIGDSIPDQNNGNYIDKIYHKDLLREIKNINETMGKRDREIMNMRFGLNGQKEHTLESIGKVYGITRERIRQVIERNVKKIRQNIRKEILA